MVEIPVINNSVVCNIHVSVSLCRRNCAASELIHDLMVGRQGCVRGWSEAPLDSRWSLEKAGRNWSEMISSTVGIVLHATDQPFCFPPLVCQVASTPLAASCLYLTNLLLKIRISGAFPVIPHLQGHWYRFHTALCSVSCADPCGRHTASPGRARGFS